MWKLVAVGVIVHLLLLSAVFDIYFVSPIQQGMTPHKAEGVAPAKRVVLVVADGLRAESLYHSQMKSLAPFLSSKIDYVGSWGVSHTQVPTESRPGHVAILAGFNEDPSAITRGWKYNPVEFDSVINQSNNAWCWGSPDIVDIFNKDNLSHIHLDSYDAFMQDFSGKSVPANLDTWVFNKVHDFFVTQEMQQCTDVCEDGNLFFLHLLGLDTAGHSFKPRSKTYMNTIKLVDEGLKSVVDKFEQFFQDGRTAYIFTADHGMTNWGSHGDGSTHETDVPFIAWGSGIAHNTTLQDLEQANIAALISALIGINFPINSLGVVPLNYLGVSGEQKAHIMHANALQLAEQYITKHLNLKENTMSLLFQPFPELSENLFVERLRNLNASIRNKNFQLAIHESYKAIDLFKNGLKYYYNYYQNLLLIFVTTGFIGWIVYLFISIKDLNTLQYRICNTHVDTYYSHMWDIPGGSVAIALVICLLPLAASLPVKYYLYCLFPIFTWCMVLSNYKHGLISIAVLSSFNWNVFLCMIVCYIGEIELLIFTFFEHYYLTILFVFLACRESVKRLSEFPFWIAGLLLLGICPSLLRMQTVFDYQNQLIGLALWSYYGYMLKTDYRQPHRKDNKMLIFQFGLLFVAFINSLIVELTRELGLFSINQYISWILLPLSLVCPLLISTKLHTRVLSSIVALVTPYTLMAIGHESIFMFGFAQHMLNWLISEHELRQLRFPYCAKMLKYYKTDNTSTKKCYTNRHSVKMCFYLLAFIMLSYFGTGNTASINSFDPMWTKCFVTVFSPFTMTSLILVKLTIPFLIVMCAFRGVMIINKDQPRNTFLIILLFCDLMVIHFLYFVKNEGSWLEIGLSLSRFIIVNVTTIFLLLLYQIAWILTTVKLKYPDFVLKLKFNVRVTRTTHHHVVE